MAQQWIVKFTVDDDFVADGFQLTEELALDMIQSAVPYAASEEVSAEIIEMPQREAIEELQGG